MPTHSSDADTTTSTIAIYDIEELTGEPIQKDLYFIVGLTRQSKIMSRRLCDMLKMVGRQEQSAIVHAFVDDVSDLSDDDLEYVEFVTFDVVGLMEDVFYALKDIVEKMWRSNVCRSISFIFGWSIENKSEKANELIVEILKNRPTVRMFFAYGREDVISNDVPRYPASIISDLKAVTVGNY
jgi:hypothetical protein